MKAKLVKYPEDYHHSSYCYYAQGKADDLLTPSPAYLGLSQDSQGRRIGYADYVQQIRIQEEMTDRGLLIGAEA